MKHLGIALALGYALQNRWLYAIMTPLRMWLPKTMLSVSTMQEGYVVYDVFNQILDQQCRKTYYQQEIYAAQLAQIFWLSLLVCVIEMTKVLLIEHYFKIS